MRASCLFLLESLGGESSSILLRAALSGLRVVLAGRGCWLTFLGKKRGKGEYNDIIIV